MRFCSECGTRLIETSKFCGACGTQASDDEVSVSYSPQPTQQQSTIQKPQTYQPMPIGNQRYTRGFQYSGEKQRTTPLSILIFIEWLIFFILVVATVFTLFIFFPIAIVIGLLTWLQYWIVKGLSEYNNNARTVLLILTIIGFVLNLLSGTVGGIIGFAITIFTIYTLGFHQETIELFE